MVEKVVKVNVDPCVHCREAAAIIKANPGCILINLDQIPNYKTTSKTNTMMGLLQLGLTKGQRCKVIGDYVEDVVSILEGRSPS